MVFGLTLRFLYGNYDSFHIGTTSDNKAAGLSSVGPTQLIQHSGPSEEIGLRRRSRRRHEEREEKRRAWPLSGVRSRFLRTSRIVDESFMGHAWRYYSPLSRTPRTTTHGQLNVTPYNNGAACLPFCSPLSSTILERAGVPAGKQSRPIAPLPYPRWTNRGPPRRAKMNGSLSPHWLASLWSSLLPIPPALSSFLFSRGYLSFALASLHHALAFRPYHTFLSALLSSALCAPHRSTLFSAFSLASAVLFTTLPYTQHCCAAFGRLARYVSLSLFSSTFLVLPFPYALFSRFLPCRSLFFVLCFLASQQFFVD